MNEYITQNELDNAMQDLRIEFEDKLNDELRNINELIDTLDNALKDIDDTLDNALKDIDERIDNLDLNA